MSNHTSYGAAARSEHELTIDELDAVSGGFEYTERTHGAVIRAGWNLAQNKKAA